MILMPNPGVDVSSHLTFVRGAIQPTRIAAAIDDSMEKYFEVIEYGALEHVYRVPNQPWSDFKASNGYRQMFMEAIDLHRHRGDDGDMQGVARTVRYGGL